MLKKPNESFDNRDRIVCWTIFKNQQRICQSHRRNARRAFLAAECSHLRELLLNRQNPVGKAIYNPEVNSYSVSIISIGAENIFKVSVNSNPPIKKPVFAPIPSFLSFSSLDSSFIFLPLRLLRLDGTALCRYFFDTAFHVQPNFVINRNPFLPLTSSLRHRITQFGYNIETFTET